MKPSISNSPSTSFGSHDGEGPAQLTDEWYDAEIVPDDDTLFAVQRITEDQLTPLVSDPCSLPFDIFRKIEEIGVLFGLSLNSSDPDWEKFSPPSWLELDSLIEATQSDDFELARTLAREIARRAGMNV